MSAQDSRYIDIVFDGPPGPEGGRFVEVENERGESIRAGEWIEQPERGTWVLRVLDGLPCPDCRAGSREVVAVQSMKVVPEGFFIKREEPKR